MLLAAQEQSRAAMAAAAPVMEAMPVDPVPMADPNAVAGF
jgi:hypothetical protein